MAPLKIAMLGVQHYHSNFWARAINQSEKAEVIGLWEQDIALAATFSQSHGIPSIANLDDLIARCDAVAVCSATADHLSLVRAAALQRKAVLCEKPLGITSDACRRIREEVVQSGIAFMQSFPKRFDPVNHEILQLVRSGALGKITMCRIRHGHSHGLDEEFRKAWFVDPEKSGGGTLLDEGIHAADLLRWLFGEPESVSAVLSSTALRLPVEDAAIATFLYPDGMIAEIATSWSFTAADTSIEIFGTEGTVLLSGVDIASRSVRDSEFLRVFERRSGHWMSSETVPHFKTGVFHEHVAWAFISALDRGGEMPVTLEDGVRAFAMIEAAYCSARSNKREVIKYDRGRQPSS
jgi:predicted dehydrogenase